jgi:hypothetical protein
MVAAAVFGSLLLNVAATFDDPDRLSLIVAITLIPYIVAILQAALRRADGALIWWLEVDADRGSLARFKDEDVAATVQRLISDHAVGLQNQHVPSRLRRAAITERSAYLAIAVTLCLSWFAAALPFGMAIVFALLTTDSPDRMNAMLASLYVATALSAALAVALASWPQRSLRSSLVGAFSIVWFEVQASTLRWFGWGLSIFLLLILGKALIDLVCGQDWSFGKWWGPVVVLATGFAGVYLKASATVKRGLSLRQDRTRASLRHRADIWWLCAAAACDATRLWCLIWLLRATSVLPFSGRSGIGNRNADSRRFRRR